MKRIEPSYLPIAVRVWAERMDKGSARTRASARRRAAKKTTVPRAILVIDAETTPDAIQRLNFLSYRYSRVSLEQRTPITDLAEEGLVHADDLQSRNPEGFVALGAYARRHRLRFWSQREFVNKVLYPAAYKARATVVGFNLNFDLSRLAYWCGEARARFAGGFSFGFWQHPDRRGGWRENRYRPRLAIKTIDSLRALRGFTRPAALDEEDQIPEGSREGKPDPAYTFRGHLLDLRQWAFALTDERYTLERACEAFGVEHGKIAALEHGRITPKYIEYNRRDVLATEELFCKLFEDHLTHPIALQPTRAYSPASVGKAYLLAIGIRPILERQPDFPREVLGYAMAAFYGGRAECRIRRVQVPVVLVDFLSMYPTNCIQLKIWDLLTCERIEVADATEGVQAMVSALKPGDCFRPALWERFVCLVQLIPQGDILPVRARYGDGPTWGIGVNPLTASEPMWFTLPDVIASTILTGRPPQILRALRLVPVGRSPFLRPIRLRGAVPVYPRSQDFFRVVVEERKSIQAREDIPPVERDRLAGFLKVLANATSYGINAEMVRHELPRTDRETVRVYGGDLEPFEVAVAAPEEAGEFAFPPIAACITGAARLRLALLEHLVTRPGGTYAFCDTDSMAIVATKQGGLIPCPGGPHRLPDGREAIRALSWKEVEGIREAFASLNPYDLRIVPGSILEITKQNFHEQE